MNARHRPSGRVLGASLVLFGAFTGAFLAGCASGQPHMQSALDQLLATKSDLQAATSDKGGHRVKAIELIDEAVEQVQRGIEFARHH